MARGVPAGPLGPDSVVAAIGGLHAPAGSRRASTPVRTLAIRRRSRRSARTTAPRPDGSQGRLARGRRLRGCIRIPGRISRGTITSVR
jgi:hypothetical protein